MLKNVEVADFSVKNSTPVFKVIDRPVYPLKTRGSNLLKFIVIGIVIGGFLGVGFVFARKIWREIMA